MECHWRQVLQFHFPVINMVSLNRKRQFLIYIYIHLLPYILYRMLPHKINKIVHYEKQQIKKKVKKEKTTKKNQKTKSK